MSNSLNFQQMELLEFVLEQNLKTLIIKNLEEITLDKTPIDLLHSFLSAKKIEGCSEKSLKYYFSTIEALLNNLNKNVCEISTNDLRLYLSDYQNKNNSSKVTIDNIRRIFSSFFSWLEDEDYILKSPVRRIHKVKTAKTIKEILTDEEIEKLRDNSQNIRDLSIVEILSSTGMRVGELVKINIKDVDFQERSCIVTGKGNKQREVYFDARTKIHLLEYINQRKDNNEALFVSHSKPNKRLTINSIETILRKLGKKCNIHKVHPHKFRRTLATMAIDKGMPIEQVQKLLGHTKIDTTMHYAMVNQVNVKMAHRKFIS
ncbi:site-specific tyrosine recombinase/integron integrase [Riemerella anatipestifer]|nr:site-specific tyrosine recombinase/integron integrase [Riemerella anatipestifer]MDY3528923.1 tyrosine-type recombinase/integrase [Riemerella anatipestifer]MDY3537699.1 tyrosine-type recombinase/integrase [Riemerella anatipestifer]